MDDQQKADAFALFVDLMATASRFGQGSQDDSGEGTGVADAGQYGGDTTLFEIACYTFSRLETWLAVNRPAEKEALADQLTFWLTEIFAVAWRQSEEAVGRRLSERLDMYRALAKSDEAAVGGEVVRRVLATRGDRFAKDGQPLPEADRVFVESNLQAYVQGCLPELLAAAEDYCTGRQVVSQPEAENAEASQEVRDYRLAMALLAQKDFLRARNAFSKVLAANPENYSALLERGRLQVQLQEPAAAIEDFSRAIAAAPGDARAYLERGICYHRILRLADKAQADFDRAIGLAPDNAIAHFARAALFDEIAQAIERQGDESDKENREAKAADVLLGAVDGYSRAVALDPAFDQAYVGRGLAHARRARTGKSPEDAAKAVADLEKAMELNWENGYLYKTVDELKELLAADQPATV